MTAKRGDAEQARDHGVARQGGHVGVAALTDKDRVQDGGEDLFLGWRVRAGVSQRTRVDERLPRLTHFEEVDKVSQQSMAGDGWGGTPALEIGPFSKN